MGFALFSLCALYLVLAGRSSQHSALLSPEDELSGWIDRQEIVSFSGIFDNLGGGARAKDAALGAVIASPSTEEPDYYYQWVRDAAIVYKTIIGQYISGLYSLSER